VRINDIRYRIQVNMLIPNKVGVHNRESQCHVNFQNLLLKRILRYYDCKFSEVRES